MVGKAADILQCFKPRHGGQEAANNSGDHQPENIEISVEILHHTRVVAKYRGV